MQQGNSIIDLRLAYMDISAANGVAIELMATTDEMFVSTPISRLELIELKALTNRPFHSSMTYEASYYEYLRRELSA